MTAPLLPGFAFTGFRSVRGDLQVVGPLEKVNLVAGQNNAGKSNILRFAQQYLNGANNPPSGLDMPREQNAASFRFAIARRVTDEDLRLVIPAGHAQAEDRVRRLFAADHFHLTSDDLIWFQYSAESNNGGGSPRYVLAEDWIQAIARDHGEDVNVLSMLLTQQQGGFESDARRVLDRFAPTGLPLVRTVQAFRQITAASPDVDEDFFAGRGLIRGLQRLQNPVLDQQQLKERFEAVNRFLQTVLEDGSARLEVPHDAQSILVHRGDLVLPLDHLGTGVHQVVILAVVATLTENTLIGVEEPEVHLHPLLQRKLIRYLTENTSNQYLIATHSAHMLDHTRAAVFHVQQTDGGTEVQRAGTPAKVAALCADLGYRPSDLLQANAVIWVEGPSDRTYLRRWITLLDDSLIEGIHYSIMFYGGRLLNHLTANDPEIDEFISLRALNRHIAIMIDSDKTRPRGHIGETKKRVRDEFDVPEYPGFAWITDGRTIENYVPLDVLKQALAEVHPEYTLTYDGGKWNDPLAVTSRRRATPRVDKVRLAHVACDAWTVEQLDHRDLLKQVRRVVEFIRLANGSLADMIGTM